MGSECKFFLAAITHELRSCCRGASQLNWDGLDLSLAGNSAFASLLKELSRGFAVPLMGVGESPNVVMRDSGIGKNYYEGDELSLLLDLTEHFLAD